MQYSFKVGQYVIYKNGNSYQIGKIKSLSKDSAFVYYHSGNTAAKTPYDLLHPITNDYCIEKSSFGGKEQERSAYWIEYKKETPKRYFCSFCHHIQNGAWAPPTCPNCDLPMRGVYVK